MNQEDTKKHGFQPRIFYGTISEICVDQNEASFKIKMSNYPNGYEPAFRIKAITSQEFLTNFHISDIVKVISEYDAYWEGPDFTYPVTTITLLSNN